MFNVMDLVYKLQIFSLTHFSYSEIVFIFTVAVIVITFHADGLPPRV